MLGVLNDIIPQHFSKQNKKLIIIEIECRGGGCKWYFVPLSLSISIFGSLVSGPSKLNCFHVLLQILYT